MREAGENLTRMKKRRKNVDGSRDKFARGLNWTGQNFSSCMAELIFWIGKNTYWVSKPGSFCSF